MHLTGNHIGRSAVFRRRMLIVAMALPAPLAIASPAAALTHHPQGSYASFADCPLSNNAVELCTVANTISGEITVGNRRVPITKTIRLQGGLVENPQATEFEFVAAEDGNTMSKTAMNVPGGLLGIEAPRWWPTILRELFNKTVTSGKMTGVTETTELAEPASAIKLNTTNLIIREGVAMKLPVKIKLNNAFLGSECYIGSASSPVILNLVTGTTSPPGPNKPISGRLGTLEFLEGASVISIGGNSLVDNAFSAPGANGCGGIFAPLVDQLVDSIVGVPSAAGHNTATLNGKLEVAAPEAIRESE
jgi:hypothetical protein